MALLNGETDGAMQSLRLKLSLAPSSVGGDQFAEAELVFSARCAGSLASASLVPVMVMVRLLELVAPCSSVMMNGTWIVWSGTGFQVLVFADAGIEGPLAVGVDAEAGRGSLVQGVGRLGAIVGVGGGKLAADLRVFLHGAAGGAGHRCIVGAVDMVTVREVLLVPSATLR